MEYIDLVAGVGGIAVGCAIVAMVGTYVGRKIGPKPTGWGFDLAPVNACIWKAADGWRFKVGYEIPGTLDTDWKVMSTEAYDTQREARADLVKIVCTGWTIDEVEG